MPVWYLLADDIGTPRCYLSGASIGRVMQGRMLGRDHGQLRPLCGHRSPCAPAVRCFGTVKGKGTSGRVRFTDAEATQYRALENKTLPILSGPKPQCV